MRLGISSPSYSYSYSCSSRVLCSGSSPTTVSVLFIAFPCSPVEGGNPSFASLESSFNLGEIFVIVFLSWKEN